VRSRNALRNSVGKRKKREELQRRRELQRRKD